MAEAPRLNDVIRVLQQAPDSNFFPTSTLHTLAQVNSQFLILSGLLALHTLRASLRTTADSAEVYSPVALSPITDWTEDEH